MPRSALQLLLCLALEPDRRVPRDHVMAALWPDAAPAKAASRLTSALWRLRKALSAVPGVVTLLQDGALRLNLSAAVRLDLAELRQQAADFAENPQADVPETLAGPDGIDEPFRGWYAPWLLRERVRLENLQEHCLRTLLERQMQSRAFDEAAATAERLLQADPLLEDIHEALIDIHTAQGRPGLAKRQFDRCAAVLTSELGVAPSTRLAAKIIGLERPATHKPRAASKADLLSACQILRRSCQDLQRVSDMLSANG